MPRAVRFLVRNWPLKVGAVALSLVLYTGLVVSQNARVWSGQVPIQPLNQPPGAFLLDDPGVVTSVRLYAPPDLANQITSQDFRATIDLAGMQAGAGGQPRTVKVSVVALDPRIQVIDFRPQQVSIRLDPVQSKVVPIVIDHGTIPPSLQLGASAIEPQSATVRGASTLLDRVTRVIARVTIDPNGINVDADVSLVAADDRNDVVTPVDVSPDHAHVRIDVISQVSSRAVPVAPQLAGALPAGYQVLGVVVSPTVVTVTGDPTLLASLQSVPTVPIDISRATSDLARSVALAPPSGITVLGATSVQVTVRIGPQRGTQTFGVGLTLVGARGDRTYQLSVTSVLVTLAGTAPTLAGIDGGSLVASLEVGSLDPGSHVVTVFFKPPAGTTVVSISPATITVVVSSGPTPTPT